jgi:hypothetical protein
MVQSIRFFAENTEPSCIGRKMFKLLYLADVLHTQETGQPITGLEWVSRNSTPLPHRLKHELLEGRGQDLVEAVEITEYAEGGAKRHSFAPSEATTFQSDVFTRRQLRILRELASQFYGEKHEDIPVGAFDRGAWDQTPVNGDIDLLKVLDPAATEFEALNDSALEYREHVLAA